MKLLQKQEQKQFQDLAFKNQLVKEQQEKRFEVERTTLMKNYDNDLSSMIDSQKKQVDKCEQQQHEELKVSSKRIRNEQEKELKGFRESLKQEVCTKLLSKFGRCFHSNSAGEALEVRGRTVTQGSQKGGTQDAKRPTGKVAHIQNLLGDLKLPFQGARVEGEGIRRETE